jgi:ATP-dependent Clp protease ATP-binding subunit ClpC
LEVAKVVKRHKARNNLLQLDEKAKDFLVSKGFDPLYGARPMRRSVERLLEDPLAEEILKGIFHEGEPLLVTMENDRLVFSQKAAAEGALSS